MPLNGSHEWSFPFTVTRQAFACGRIAHTLVASSATSVAGSSAACTRAQNRVLAGRDTASTSSAAPLAVKTLRPP